MTETTESWAAARDLLANPRDPVCGMEVSSVHPNAQTEWHGTLYRFCSEECQRKFAKNAESYAERRWS